MEYLPQKKKTDYGSVFAHSVTNPKKKAECADCRDRFQWLAVDKHQGHGNLVFPRGYGLVVWRPLCKRKIEGSNPSSSMYSFFSYARAHFFPLLNPLCLCLSSFTRSCSITYRHAHVRMADTLHEGAAHAGFFYTLRFRARKRSFKDRYTPAGCSSGKNLYTSKAWRKEKKAKEMILEA